MNKLFVTTSVLLLLAATPTFGNLGLATTSGSPSASTINSDDKITSDVKTAISSDKDLARFLPLIIIRTDNGTVVLSGFVADEKGRLAIAEKAKGIPGVAHVLNRLEVKPDQYSK